MNFQYIYFSNYEKLYQKLIFKEQLSMSNMYFIFVTDQTQINSIWQPGKPVPVHNMHRNQQHRLVKSRCMHFTWIIAINHAHQTDDNVNNDDMFNLYTETS